MPRALVPVCALLLVVVASRAAGAYKQAEGFPWALSLTSTGQFLGVAVDSSFPPNHFAVGWDNAQDRFGTIRRSQLCAFGATSLLSWMSPFGSVNPEAAGARAVAVDGADNILVAGSVDSSDGEAWIVCKYDGITRALLWSRTFMGTTWYAESRANALSADAANVVVAGHTKWDAAEGGNNWLVVKYDLNGTLVWSRTYDCRTVPDGPGGTDQAYGVALDTAGNVYVAGYETRADLAEGRNWRLIKYDLNGEVQWRRTHNGEDDGRDMANGVTVVDGAGSVVVAGYEDRGDVNQDRNWLLIKYDPAGTIVWSRSYNSPADGRDEASGVAANVADGSVVAVGKERRSDLGQKYDWMVRKYDVAGALLWSRTHNSGPVSGDEAALSCAVDAAGNVLVGGYEDCALEWCGLGWVRRQRWALRKYDPTGAMLWMADAPVSRQETASALGIDARNWAWLAGRQLRPRRGQDVLVQIYSLTQTGRVMSASLYDYGNGDEGPPGMWVGSSPKPNLLSYESEVFVAFSTASTVFASSTELTTWFATGPFESDWAEIRETMEGGTSLRGGAVARLVDMSPVTVGTVTANGVDQFVGIRELRQFKGAAYEYGPRITATYWSGSAEPIIGRAVTSDSLGGYWAAAEQGADLLLFRYTDTGYADATVGDYRAKITPGYPKRLVTAAVDRIRAAAHDSMSNVWIAGGIDAEGAIWKFSSGGQLFPGFPLKFSRGASTVLNDLTVDGSDNVLAVGDCDQNAMFVGVSNDGTPLPGLGEPMLLSLAPDRLGGAGVAIEPGGAVWLAGTADAAASSTLWAGSAAVLLRLEFVPEAPAIPPGNVALETPEGAVINLLRGGRLTILVHPTQGGKIKMQVMTMRGEPVWEHAIQTNGNTVETFVWDGRNSGGREVASGAYAVRIAGAGLGKTMRTAVIRR